VEIKTTFGLSSHQSAEKAMSSDGENSVDDMITLLPKKVQFSPLPEQNSPETSPQKGPIFMQIKG
jgi:hypothetical protein